LNSKKSICFVVSAPLTASVFLKSHMEELNNSFDIYLVANFIEDSDYSLFKNIHLHHIPIKRGIDFISDFSALLELIKFFRTNKFNVIHSVSPKAGLLAITASYISGIKNRIHIFTGQVWANDRGLRRSLFMLLDKLIVTLSTTILVDGHSQRNFLIENNIIKPNQGLVLGNGSINGVNTNLFKQDLLLKAVLRKEYNIKEDALVFLYLGRLKRDKGVLDLAFSFNTLQKEYPKCKMVCIGPDEEHIQKDMKLLSENIIFIEFTNRPHELLNLGDVFCLPSFREGFGTSIIEASATGLPIICSNIYGLKDTIIDNNTGFFFKVRDRQDLLRKMRFFAINPDEIDVFGKKGRQYVLENFKSTFVTSKWVKFYNDLLN